MLGKSLLGEVCEKPAAANVRSTKHEEARVRKTLLLISLIDQVQPAAIGLAKTQSVFLNLIDIGRALVPANE